MNVRFVIFVIPNNDLFKINIKEFYILLCFNLKSIIKILDFLKLLIAQVFSESLHKYKGYWGLLGNDTWNREFLYQFWLCAFRISQGMQVFMVVHQRLFQNYKATMKSTWEGHCIPILHSDWLFLSVLRNSWHQLQDLTQLIKITCTSWYFMLYWLCNWDSFGSVQEQYILFDSLSWLNSYWNKTKFRNY